MRQRLVVADGYGDPPRAGGRKIRESLLEPALAGAQHDKLQTWPVDCRGRIEEQVDAFLVRQATDVDRKQAVFVGCETNAIA